MICYVLFQMPKLSQANRLVQILQLLKDMINGNRDTVSRNQGQIIYDVINTHIFRILNVLKKGKVGYLETLFNVKFLLNTRYELLGITIKICEFKP